MKTLFRRWTQSGLLRRCIRHQYPVHYRQQPQRGMKIIIDCDPGVDDAIAILMAIKEAKRRKYEILGITASFGNVKLPQVLKNLAKVLEVLPEGRDIPVFPGCSQALVMNTTDYFPWHGVDGLGDAGLPEREREFEEEHASNAIVRLCSKYPGEVSLICLGPLTNLAIACRLKESLPSLVKELIWMGGCTYARGNVSLVSEFNAHSDPEAAHMIFVAFEKLTMVSWELTKESALSWQHFDDFLAKADVSSLPQGQLIHAVCKPFIRDRETSEGAIICDAVAMAVALDPSVIRESQECFVDVELSGTYSRGQTVIDWDNKLRRKANVRLVQAIDMDAFHRMLLGVLEP